MAEKFDPKYHIGEVHGIYTIADITGEKDKYGHWIYKCICNQCGFEKYSHYGAIVGKREVNVCKHLRVNGEYILHRHVWESQRLKRIFHGMLLRCYNIENKDYFWYGHRGIQICEQWLNNPSQFEEWALANGYSDDLTIDRVESDKNYCPENCRWIPLEDNSRRAGSVNWIEVDGITLTGAQWAKRLNVGVNAINRIIREYGENKAKELIYAMLKEPPETKPHKSNQSWLSVYGIQD